MRVVGDERVRTPAIPASWRPTRTSGASSSPRVRLERASRRASPRPAPAASRAHPVTSTTLGRPASRPARRRREQLGCALRVEARAEERGDPPRRTPAPRRTPDQTIAFQRPAAAQRLARPTVPARVSIRSACSSSALLEIQRPPRPRSRRADTRPSGPSASSSPRASSQRTATKRPSSSPSGAVGTRPRRSARGRRPPARPSIESDGRRRARRRSRSAHVLHASGPGRARAGPTRDGATRRRRPGSRPGVRGRRGAASSRRSALLRPSRRRRPPRSGTGSRWVVCTPRMLDLMFRSMQSFWLGFAEAGRGGSTELGCGDRAAIVPAMPRAVGGQLRPLRQRGPAPEAGLDRVATARPRPGRRERLDGLGARRPTSARRRSWRRPATGSTASRWARSASSAGPEAPNAGELDLLADPTPADFDPIVTASYGWPGIAEAIEGSRRSSTPTSRGSTVGRPAASGSGTRMATRTQLVGTIPEARGRGLASRLLRLALVDARERGCTTTTLQEPRWAIRSTPARLSRSRSRADAGAAEARVPRMTSAWPPSPAPAADRPCRGRRGRSRAPDALPARGAEQRGLRPLPALRALLRRALRGPFRPERLCGVPEGHARRMGPVRGDDRAPAPVRDRHGAAPLRRGQAPRRAALGGPRARGGRAVWGDLVYLEHAPLSEPPFVHCWRRAGSTRRCAGSTAADAGRRGLRWRERWSRRRRCSATSRWSCPRSSRCSARRSRPGPSGKKLVAAGATAGAAALVIGGYLGLAARSTAGRRG